MKIPANSYWVMGDNRGNSKDSRVFGTIAKDEIVGRVFVRIWPLSRLGSCSASCHVALRSTSVRRRSIPRRSRPSGRDDRSRRRRRACAAPRAAGVPLARPTRTRARRTGGTARPDPRSTRCGACSSRRSRSTRARTRGVRAAPRSRAGDRSARGGPPARRAAVAARRDRGCTPRAARARRTGGRRRRARRRVGRLHVDRALERRAELLVHVGEPRDRRARPARPRCSSAIRRRRRPRRTTGSCAQTTSPSAESHTSVSSPVTPACSARSKAGDRVLGLLEAGPPVGEGDDHVASVGLVTYGYVASGRSAGLALLRSHGRAERSRASHRESPVTGSSPQVLKRPLGPAEG